MTKANMSRDQDPRSQSGAGDAHAARLDDETGQNGHGLETRMDPDTIETISQIDQGGVEQSRVITTKDFMPGRDKQWAKDHVASQPAGTKVFVGTLAGEVYGFERVTNEHQGKRLESIKLRGRFEAVIASTGEIKKANWAYLPMAVGEEVENAFVHGDAKTLTLDMELALRSRRGEMIDYEWVSISYIEDQANEVVRAVRKRQDARALKRGPQALLTR